MSSRCLASLCRRVAYNVQCTHPWTPVYSTVQYSTQTIPIQYNARNKPPRELPHPIRSPKHTREKCGVHDASATRKRSSADPGPVPRPRLGLGLGRAQRSLTGHGREGGGRRRPTSDGCRPNAVQAELRRHAPGRVTGSVIRVYNMYGNGTDTDTYLSVRSWYLSWLTAVLGPVRHRLAEMTARQTETAAVEGAS